MLCLSGFELYSRWVLLYCTLGARGRCYLKYYMIIFDYFHDSYNYHRHHYFFCDL